MRLNFSASGEDELREGIRRIGHVITEQIHLYETITGEHRVSPPPDEPMTIRVAYHAREETSDVMFGIAFYDANGNNLFGTNTRILDVDVPTASGEFARVPLLDGTYWITLGIVTADEGTVYDWQEQKYTFEVMNPSQMAGMVSFPVEIKFASDELHRVEGS